MEREDAIMIMKILAILGGIFALLAMLSGAAQASGSDGRLTHGQCLNVMSKHGHPCIHKIPVFASFGIGKTPVSGKRKSNPSRTEGGNNWFANFAAGGDIQYVAEGKTVYDMDGTPQQCVDPCAPCLETGYCKYHVDADYNFTWVRVDGD